ncbi:MAG: DUF3604 domain-containing protein [Planctomycetaceae bacterium]|nr:DUF3604 domain-containing protein [Planctomycetaceae bacterium]
MSNEGIITVVVGGALPPKMVLRLTDAVPAGALLRLRGNSFTAAMSVKVVAVRADGASLEIVHRMTMEEMVADWDFFTETFSAAIVKIDKALSAGALLELDIPEMRSSHTAGVTWAVSAGVTDAIKSRSFAPVTAEAGFQFIASSAATIKALRKPDGAVFVEQFDCHDNPAISDGSEITLVGGDGGTTAKPQAALAATRVELPAAARGLRVTVTDAAGRTATSNPTPLAADGTPIWFGEFHWHCHVSCDAQRNLADALTSARDELCLDFAGPADHMAMTGKYYTPLTTRYQTDVLRRFNEPGRFCPIVGAELGCRGGHGNIYCDSIEMFLELTDRFESELWPRYKGPHFFYDLHHLASLCTPGKTIIVPHHTNRNTGGMSGPDGRPLWNAMHFPIPPERRAVRLFEIVQGSGCYESEVLDEQWKIACGGLGGSARTALMRGYRFGFTGGTDNHDGWPSVGHGACNGLTAVQSRTLDSASIFRALYERRCYATSGARIAADVTCNGYPMGSEIRLAASDTPVFDINIHGTAPIAAVQIVHCGFVLADLPVEMDCLDFKAQWADDRRGRPLEEAWYFVRARQTDGQCVWCSPFWIDL